MQSAYFSMGLTILGYFSYHIFQKSVSTSINPLLAICMAYATGLLFGIVLLLASGNAASALQTVLQANWAVYAIGISVFIMEIGFLLSYRNGMSMSTGVTVCNAIVILLLVPVGIYFFREQLHYSTLVGIFCCVCGLLLIHT